MKDETYGVKLSMDLTDFNKGVKQVQDKVKGLEEKVKINIAGDGFDFSGKFKDLGIDELQKKLEKSQKQLEQLFEKANKVDYNELTGVTEIIPQGTIEEMDAYKEKLAEVAELEDEIAKKTPEIKLDKTNSQEVEQEEKQLETMSMTVGQVKQRIIELSAYKRKLESQSVVSEEEQKSLEKTNQQLEEYISLLEGIGVTVPKIKAVSTETENVGKKMDGLNGKSSGVGINLDKSFTKATKSLKRFALSLFGIRSVFSMISRAMRSYMSQNEDLQKKMTAVWSGLGTLLAPIVDYLANLFFKLLGYINVVTKALFNFDFIAKANANTLKNYSKQAQKTSKALGGFDELTNVNQQSGADEGGPALIEVPELDEGIVKVLEDMSNALKDNWGWLSKVLIVIGAIFGATAVAGWIANFSKFIAVLSSNPFALLVVAIVALVALIIANWDTIKNVLTIGIKALVDTILSIIEFNINIIIGIFTTLINILINPFIVLGDTIVGVFNGIKTTMIGIFNVIKGLFTGDWKTVMNGFKQIFKGVFNSLWSIAKAPLNLIIGGLNSLIKGANKISFDVPDWVPGIGGKKWGFNIKTIPKLAIGTDNVKSEGLAYLHAGEKVVPANVAKGGYSGDNGEVSSLLRELIEVVQQKDFNATISSDDVGKASVNYIRNQNRIMGGSVI